MIASGPGGFRHQSIEDGHVLFQQLGRENGFDVDIWDSSYPAESLPDTPFTSAADLAKYKVIIGNSSVGQTVFQTAYTMKDGTVVNLQAGSGLHENGGGFVAIHGGTDSMGNWPWFMDLIGAGFSNHPGNAGGFGTDCGSCYNAELITEDNSHPATAGLPARFRVIDELYAFNRKPRPYVHPLMLLNDDTLGTAIGVTAPGRRSRARTTRSRAAATSTAAACSPRRSATTGSFREHGLVAQHDPQGGSMTTGGVKPPTASRSRGPGPARRAAAAGTLTADAAAAAKTAVNAAYDKYAPLTRRRLQRVAGRHRRRCAPRREPGQRRRGCPGEAADQGAGAQGLDG